MSESEKIGGAVFLQLFQEITRAVIFFYLLNLAQIE